MWSGGLRFQVRFFIWQVLLGWVNTVDRLVRRRTSLVGPFCCLLCWKEEEDLDNLFWDSQFAWVVWSSFFQEFGISFAGTRSVRAMIEEFLLHSPFRDKGSFLWLAGVCAVMWDIWGKRNDRVLRGRRGCIVRFVFG